MEDTRYDVEVSGIAGQEVPPSDNHAKLFYSLTTQLANKVERLPLGSLFSIVFSLLVRPEPTRVEQLFDRLRP